MSNKSIHLSVVVLAKNEAPRIHECLKSVSFADEIILIDNQSTDTTVEIAKQHGVTVFSDASSDFSKLRNLGKKYAHGTWILYVDADEIVTEQLKEEIQYIIKNNTVGQSKDTSVNAYSIYRQNYYLGVRWPTEDKMERFFKKGTLTEWYGELHETAKVVGMKGELTAPLIHNTHRTLSEMTSKTNTWSDIEAKLRYDAHHPPVVGWRFFRVMATAFWKSYIVQKGYKAKTAGIIESLFQSFSMFITYAKLWELQRQNK